MLVHVLGLRKKLIFVFSPESAASEETDLLSKVAGIFGGWGAQTSDNTEEDKQKSKDEEEKEKSTNEGDKEKSKDVEMAEASKESGQGADAEKSTESVADKATEEAAAAEAKSIIEPPFNMGKWGSGLLPWQTSSAKEKEAAEKGATAEETKSLSAEGKGEETGDAQPKETTEDQKDEEKTDKKPAADEQPAPENPVAEKSVLESFVANFWGASEPAAEPPNK
eukprot:GHVT01034047.1.p5 GENE.GHVT01034047.1~~GHVT01034047.1.p5  ORF type:complete len:223 (+),score=59.33 GHVT01034047.1:1894-2562(+)